MHDKQAPGTLQLDERICLLEARLMEANEPLEVQGLVYLLVQARLERYKHESTLGHLEQAIGGLRSLVMDPILVGEARSSIENDLGEALRLRHRATSSPRDLDEAVLWLRKAVEGSIEPGFRMNLGNGLRDRYRLNRWRCDLDQAIEAYEQAERDLPPEAEYRPLILHNLACGLRDRFLHDAKGQVDLERAIQLFREALGGVPAGSPWTAQFTSNLATALEDRYKCTSRLADLEEAVATHQQAMAAAKADRQVLADVLNNLGNAVRNLAQRTGNTARKRALLDHCVGVLREAIAISPPGAVNLPSRWSNLGNALRDRYVLAEDEEDLATAIHSYRQALALSKGSILDRAAIRHNLANSLATVYRQHGADDALFEAILLYEASLGETPEDSPEFPDRTTNLGLALLDRAGRADSPQASSDRSRGFDLLRQASAAIRVAPESAQNAAKHWQRRALEGGEWAEVLQAHGFARAAGDRMFHAQGTRSQKEAWLRESQGLAAAAAYAAAKLGALQDAVTTLEMGLARLLAERWATEDRGSDFLTFEEIRRLASLDAPLVYMAATRAGGVALIVRADEPEVEPVWLPNLQEGELLDRMQEHFRVYGEWQQSLRLRAQWLSSLDQLAAWLRGVALDDVLRFLGTVERVHWISAGLLSFLPWQAAVVGSCQSSPKVFLHAPSARGLAGAREARSLRTQGPLGILAVSAYLDGEEDDSEPRLDAEIAAASFERRLLLADDEAARNSVLAELPRYEVLHFACHGSVEAEEPLESGLRLGQERITLQDFLSVGLDTARLVVLSACESGIPGLIVPDEAIGLPTGLLYAGAPGVIASLWAVEEEPTVYLMLRFYNLWTVDGESPATALASAQSWLRETTNREKFDYLEELRTNERWCLPREVLDVLQTELRLRHGGHRDFEHLHFWGAFFYVGL